MSSTISRAPPPNSSTASHHVISCSRCGMLYIGETGRSLRTRFGEHQRAVIDNDANHELVARHFNTLVWQLLLYENLSPLTLSHFCKQWEPQKTWNAPHFQTWNCPPQWLNERFPSIFSSFICHSWCFQEHHLSKLTSGAGGGQNWTSQIISQYISKLFLHVLYSVKACKISIYVVQFVVRNMSCFSIRWMDLVWDSSSVVQSFNHSCMCIFYIIWL
jgi:hypothetical protein